MKSALGEKDVLLPTPAEARILSALWSLGEATVEQIVRFFPEPEQPNYKTTQAFLRIMETKGFVTHSTSGKVFVFRPTVGQAEIAEASVSKLLKQSFGGSARGLFMNLLESGKLKAKELREIEALIQKHRKKQGVNS